MRVEGRNGDGERRVLIAAITSSTFLCRVAGRVGREPLRSRHANLIWFWCEDHQAKYGAAPKAKIEPIFEEWARGNSDKDTSASISRLLSQLSGQYDREGEHADVDFQIDQAEAFFNEVRLERFRRELEERLEAGEVTQALDALQGFPRLNLRSSPRIDILRDESVQKAALEEKQRVLVRYPGAAGEFFGDELAEDSFVAFMASPKGGKSYTLLDIAWRAMRQGRKVAYFQVGDLSRNQFIRRVLRRVARRPAKEGTIWYPASLVLPDDYKGLALVDHSQKTWNKPLDWPAARKAFRATAERTKGDIHLSYHPVKTVSAVNIRDSLEAWDREGYVSKVVIIDYAGNLAPIEHKMDPVNQITHTWAIMRQISEMRNCLVVTAQQSNKEGFSAWVLTRKNFSESKMILAHPTAFLGVNCTDEEKGRQITRLNFVVAREREFRETTCLYQAGCLAIANPMVLSALPEFKR